MTKLNSGSEASAVCTALACSRRSDSGARAKTKASERAGKNEGRLGDSHVFLHEVMFSSSNAVVAWPVQREHF